MVIVGQGMKAAEPSKYYNSALNKSDEELMTALCNIIREHEEVSYTSGLLNAFAKADVDDDGYIIDIYSNCRYRTSDNGSSASHVGEGYNREHSFPRSWFNGEVAPMNTDVFHIYPTDIRVNSQRGNDPYGVCANGTRLTYGNYVAKGKSGPCTYPGYRGDVFEPDDEYKGDLARTFFYMVTCYKNELPSWAGSAQLDYRTNKYKAFSTWTINMLMEWTRMDPVSEKEIKRNEVVYGIQGNRNPFIDHPELAEYIWGNKQGQRWYGNDSTDPAITAPQNGLTFNMGNTTIGDPISYKIYLKGVALTEGFTLTMSDSENFYVDANTFTANEINDGKMLTITFVADQEGTFNNSLTLSSSEATTTFTVVAVAKKQNVNPDPVANDSITEDWEGCTSGGYWSKDVQGHAWKWSFDDAGIWSDNLRHDVLSCRLGKSNNSSITMAEDYQNGSTGISLWAGNYGNDNDAILRVDYSTDKGSTWITVGTITTAKGALQQYRFDTDVEGPVRYRIVQTTGSRVNIDDITLYYGQSQEQPNPCDINLDGEVNILDINIAISTVLGTQANEQYAARADVNTDGEVNIADINAIIAVILGRN